ncbi:hypothetical protein LIA77_03853 [Sarocladium implicatum]|nr:hypothetical protein LIA77_03853 [Sarocladium implicatum]
MYARSTRTTCSLILPYVIAQIAGCPRPELSQVFPPQTNTDRRYNLPSCPGYQQSDHNRPQRGSTISSHACSPLCRQRDQGLLHDEHSSNDSDLLERQPRSSYGPEGSIRSCARNTEAQDEV